MRDLRGTWCEVEMKGGGGGCNRRDGVWLALYRSLSQGVFEVASTEA